MVRLPFFDWSHTPIVSLFFPLTSYFQFLGVFRIRPLVGVRRCLPRMKVSRKSSFTKIIGNNEEMLLAA
jgi:hypothetical protein